MNSSTSIHFDEFVNHTTFSTLQDNCTTSVLDHPEFGKWELKSIELDYFRITEHKTDLNRDLVVEVDDSVLMNSVNHCMCVGGSLGAHFYQHNLKADLNAGSYHYMSVQADGYNLAMSKRFHNIHIQASKKYYTDLLGENEDWTAKLKNQMYRDDVCYPGLYSLTPGMINTISSIFNSSLSGSLKKLMIEAKVLELIALQLNGSLTNHKETGKGKRDLFHDIQDYLGLTFLEEHSLKSICQKFGINEFALKNGFRKTFNTTVFEFILSRRLEHAQELLLNGNHSIQEISSLVGYKYSNHFSTAFKNKFGITPGKLKDK